ncbi:hypothetical protein [Natranaerovirga pectinivora]|nr:hypothetical protein [Natranaerovirga pectinivora]
MLDYNEDIKVSFQRVKRYWQLFDMSSSFGDNMFILRTIEGELKELYEKMLSYNAHIECNKMTQENEMLNVNEIEGCSSR